MASTPLHWRYVIVSTVYFHCWYSLTSIFQQQQKTKIWLRGQVACPRNLNVLRGRVVAPPNRTDLENEESLGETLLLQEAEHADPQPLIDGQQLLEIWPVLAPAPPPLVLPMQGL
jgi:hypothetical protein